MRTFEEQKFEQIPPIPQTTLPETTKKNGQGHSKRVLFFDLVATRKLERCKRKIPKGRVDIIGEFLGNPMYESLNERIFDKYRSPGCWICTYFTL
mgnify:CR=1 FL=1